jgi:DNA-binding LacI/PurR family transcriptional regulator
MPVTAKDIARELNLSQPTVSRILSGDQRHRTAEATRLRVLEAAERLGYHPNAVASSLRRGRTGIIGVHTSHDYDARNDFYGTVLGALQCACRVHQLDLLLHSAQHGTPAGAMFGRVRDGRIDGLILHASPDDPLVEMLSQASLPVVAVSDALPGIPSVTCDGAAGMHDLMDLLWRRGYRDYVFLRPEISLAAVEQRCAAFEKALHRRGVVKARRSILPIYFEHAADALDQLLQRDGHTAVCCWNDRTAYNLLRACDKRGVSVPQRLAVAGFDGFRDEHVPRYQLVTVKCPWEDVATEALRLLMALIDPHDERDPPAETVLPVTLLDGDTA